MTPEHGHDAESDADEATESGSATKVAEGDEARADQDNAADAGDPPDPEGQEAAAPVDEDESAADEPPSATSEPPSATSEPPPATSEPPSATSEAPSATSEPPSEALPRSVSLEHPPQSGLRTKLPPHVYDKLVYYGERIKPLLPWFSLMLGLIGMFLMERNPEKAWMIATSMLVAFAMSIAFVSLSRVDTEQFSEKGAFLLKCAHVGALLAKQSLLQLCLFFAVPFYFEAAQPVFSHILFLSIITLTCVALLWDPLYFRVMQHPITRSMAQFIVAFSSLNVIIPVMGISNRVSLIVAGIISIVAIPLLDAHPDPRVIGQRAGVSLVVGTMLLLGVIRWIPPAPMHLVDAKMGTRIKNYDVTDPTKEFDKVPRQLVCFTAIAAPRGLVDELVHIWHHDGQKTDEIPLDIRGGRDEGFRTWSIKRNLSSKPEGKWTCTVRTKTGQLLGRTTTTIAKPSGT